MKKFLVLLMTFACAFCLAFALAGCSSNKDDAPIEGYIYKCSQTEHWLENSDGEEKNRAAHNVADGVCPTCGYVGKCTEGLDFTEIKENEETIGYIVSKGTATDSHLYIPSFYNGLPVLIVPGYAQGYGCPGGIFAGWENLESVTIGNNVTSIGEFAFDGCVNLESVTIPDSVTFINVGAFEGTGYYNNPVNWDNDVLYINNCLIEAKETLSGSYEIKDSAKLISRHAFGGCTSLTSITIPDSLKYICEEAFYECTSLTSVIFGENSQLISIGYWAFIGCPIENLTIPGNVSQIDITAFTCNVNVSENNKHYSSLDGVLYNKDKTELIRVPQLKTSITIPDSVITIGKNAFLNCTSLANVTIPDSVITIGEWAFGGCQSLTNVTIPDSVTIIGEVAFGGCQSLTNVTISDSVTSIGDNAFIGCQSLTSVTIGNGVTSIGRNAFSGCISLESISVAEGNTNYSSQDGVLYNKDKTEIIKVPQTKTNITIPNSVTTIGDNAFSQCTSLISITIPESVTSIGERAFEVCKNLKSINIGNGVTSIGEWAFEDCESLTSVYITNIAAWCNIDFGNFDANPLYCAHNLYLKGQIVTNLDIPQGVTEIKDYAFSGCKNLESITIPEGVTTIGERAFEDCTSLESIIIPNSVTTIGERAFEDCTSLESIIIPNSVTSISDSAFNGCTNLESVTIGNGVTTIGEGAFRNCTSLESVTFENPNGWYCVEYFSDAKTDIPSEELNNSATAAWYISTYCGYDWKRETA